MLFKRQSVYYFRQRVPDDMQELLGRSELKKSLKTSNRKEAKSAASALRYKVETTYLRVRTGMLSDRELEKLAGELIGEFTGRITDHRKNRKDALDWLLTDVSLSPTVDTDTIDRALKSPKIPADVAAFRILGTLPSFSVATRNTTPGNMGSVPILC